MVVFSDSDIIFLFGFGTSLLGSFLSDDEKGTYVPLTDSQSRLAEKRREF